MLGLGLLLVATVLAVGTVPLLARRSQYFLLLIAVSTVWVSRIFVVHVGLPALITFAHYVLVGAGWVLAIATRRRVMASRVELWALAFFVTSMVSSFIVHSYTSLVLAGVFFVMVTQVILALHLGRATSSFDSRRLLLMIYALYVLQFSVAVAQRSGAPHPDFVRGTLLQHDAGAHLVGALGAVLAVVIVALYIDRHLSSRHLLAVAFAVLLLLGLTESRQVLGALAIALAAGVATVAFSTWRSRSKSRVLSMVFLALLSAWAGISFVPEPELSRVQQALAPERSGPVQAAERLGEVGGLEAVLFGAGPGMGASRVAWLVHEPSNFLRSAGISPPPNSERYASLRLDEAIAFGGSLDRPAGSWAGVITDVGIVSAALLILLLVASFMRGFRSCTLGCRFLKIASIVMLGVMGLFDHWLEYPEFVLVLAVGVAAYEGAYGLENRAA